MAVFPSFVRQVRIETLEHVFVSPDKESTYVRTAFLLEALKSGKSDLSTLSDGACLPW